MGQSADAIRRPDGADTDDEDREVIAVREEIEHTRAEMSDTLDAIQQRLNPETLTEQAKDTAVDITAQAKEAALEVVNHALQEARSHSREAAHEASEQVKAAVRGATIGKVENMVRNANETTNAARYSLMETIRANPVPALLTGLGLGWLYMNSRSAAARGTGGQHVYQPEMREQRYSSAGQPSAYRESSVYQGRGYGADYGQESRNPVSGAVDRVQETAGNVAGQAGETAGNIAGQAGYLAGQVGQTAGNVVGQIGETAGNVVGQIGETAGNLAEGAQYQAQRLEDRFGRTLRENPLAVGAVTLALGTAVGLALPQTRRENELMGEARDNLAEKVQSVAQETIEKVGHVAEEAQTTVQKEAQRQGLTQ